MRLKPFRLEAAYDSRRVGTAGGCPEFCPLRYLLLCGADVTARHLAAIGLDPGHQIAAEDG